MRNKGVLMKSSLSVSYDANIKDMITVSIHCQDRREGVVDTRKLSSMTFTDAAHGFFPGRGGPEYGVELSRAWKKIEGWLQHMGVDDCCHAYVIDVILKCYNYQLPLGCGGSLCLGVSVEIEDQYSYVPKQPRLHRRDDDVEEEEEGMCLSSGGDLKRVCLSH